MVNLLRPRKSLGSLSNKDKAFPLPQGSSTPGKQVKGDEESRWSGENLAPSDGYSGLFASGLGFKVEREGPRMPKRRNEPPPTAFPSSSHHNPSHTLPAGQARLPVPAHVPSHVLATPGRRRRSSILTAGSTSPSKYKTSSSNQSVDAALEGVMRSLKKMSTFSHTPSPQKQQSRWSISSDETERSAPMPRPSMDSVRSKISVAMSIRSRKSEERLRPSMDDLMEVDREEVPPVPCMPTRQIPAIPTTPKRLRGLRKLLTPKKRQQEPSTVPVPHHPMPHRSTTPSASATFNLPQPPAERALPKKSSFASLRSLAKKGSSTTMRSLFRDRDENEPIPCLPHAPTTPSRHSGTDRGFQLGKKGSSTTLRNILRDRDSNGPIPCLPHPPTTPSRHSGTDRGFPISKKGSSNTLRGIFRDENEVPPCLPFPTTPSRHSGGRESRPAKSSIGPPHARPATSPSKFLLEMPRRAPLTPKKDEEDIITFGDTPDLSFGSNTTPSTGRQATPMVFTPSFVLTDVHPNVASQYTSVNHDSAQSTPSMTPLTAKAQRERSNKTFGKPMHHLLPRQARYNHGLETPPSAATSTTGPVRGLPARPALTPSSFRISERRYDPAYSIINSYSRPSMGPSNTAFARRDPGSIGSRYKSDAGEEPMPFNHGAGDGWDTPMPIPFPQPQPQVQSQSSSSTSGNGYFTHAHNRHQHRGDTGTFGQRSISTLNADKSIQVDFTASPDPNLSLSMTSSALHYDFGGIGGGYRDRTISNASSDGVSQEWELEAYLKEVEARERRANVI